MEDIKITEGMRRTKLTADEVNLLKQSFIIIPYQVSGFIDYTNQGTSNFNIRPEDFETFKRVWTGNDACVINWKNSIRLEQNEKNKEMEVRYQLGEFFAGVMEVNEENNIVKTDESFNEYKSQQIEKRYTFRIPKTFEINDYYHLMFYKIPEISKSTLFRIEDIEKDFVGKELVGYVITFKTVNQDFANTGRARQQNIMPNAPGQGYLEAVVEDKKWPERIGKEKFDKLLPSVDYIEFYDRYVTADFQKTLNRPVTKVVVRLIGNGILSSFTCVGRPVIQGDSLEKYRPQRLLFPYNFTNPTTPTLFHTQNNSNNLYFGDFKPTLEFFKDLMTSIKDSLTPVNKWNYQGWLTYSYNDLKSTNPIETGNYKYDLFGYLRTDTSPTVQIPWEFNMKPNIIDTSGNFGLEQQYNIGGVKKIWDHMFDNFWTQKQYKVLPLNQTSTTTFGWTLASSLGLAVQGNFYAALPLFAIGLLGTLLGKLKPKPLLTFRGLVSAPLIDYNNKLFANTGGGNNIPFNLLDNNNKDSPSSIFFDGSTITIGFEARLTDLLESKRAPGKILSTLNIGQTVDENGEQIMNVNSPFYLNGDATILPTYDNYSGFIIDSFKIQAIFNGEISVEFKDIDDNVVWTGIYQSEGKWTNSMREIWTEKNCSVFGRENIYYLEPMPYPKPIPEPPPSFPTAVRKVINDTKMKTEYYYVADGGIHYCTRQSGYIPFFGTQYLITNNWRHNILKAQDEGSYTLLENVSKEELLQVWSNITLNYNSYQGGSSKIITMFELFSQVDNSISFEVETHESRNGRIPISILPVPFPTGSGRYGVAASSTLKITIFWENNNLNIKWKLVKPQDYGVSFYTEDTLNAVNYIFFSHIGETARAGIQSIILNPK